MSPSSRPHSFHYRTDPLEFSQTGACLSDHVHRFYGAVSNKTMRPEVRKMGVTTMIELMFD